MAIPANWSTVTVTGTYLGVGGTPRGGRVLFRCNVYLINEDEKILVVPTAIAAPLDANGQFSVEVPASNDPDITPAFQYTVVEQIDGAPERTYRVTIPDGESTADLSELVNAAAPAVTASEAVNLDVRYARTAAENVFTQPQTLESSFDGGEDDFDSTSRINLESYQSSPIFAFGEVLRAFARRKDAKQMFSWYFPAGGYDANREPVGNFKPVVWIGAHWESGSHTGNHKHWSLETPDSSGALQTRFEVVFGDQSEDDAIAGLDKTRILTNLADFIVRCSNGQVLRLSANVATEKAMEFSTDAEGVVRQWKIRSTATQGDWQLVRYDDAGNFVDAFVTVKRGTGRVGIGTTDPTTEFDVDGDKLRLRQSFTPASASAPGSQGDIAWDSDFLYVCVATDTWKRVALASW